MTVDLHTPQAQGFFDGPVDHLLAQPLLAGYIRQHYADADITVVAPDSGRVRLAETWASLLGERPIAFIQRRDTLHTNRSRTTPVAGDVRGRMCVVVDDMIDTGVTVASATRLLLAAGASGVIAAATHGVLSGDATDRLRASGIREVLLTDTLPIPDSNRFLQLTVLSIAPLLAKAIHQVFDDGSVTSLSTTDDAAHVRPWQRIRWSAYEFTRQSDGSHNVPDRGMAIGQSRGFRCVSEKPLNCA